MVSKQIDRLSAVPETIGGQVRESWASSSIFEPKITKFVNDMRDYKQTTEKEISAVWLNVTSDGVQLIPIKPAKSSSYGDGTTTVTYDYYGPVLGTVSRKDAKENPKELLETIAGKLKEAGFQGFDIHVTGEIDDAIVKRIGGNGTAKNPGVFLDGYDRRMIPGDGRTGYLYVPSK